MIPRALGRRRLARAAGLAVSAAGVLLLAVCARDPLSSADPMDRAGTFEMAEPENGQSPQNPHFTPFTVRPELVNREDVMAALEANYPPLLREAGIGGQALVWFFIDETGTVARTSINKSSGYAALDSAALSVARTMRFTPAMNGNEKAAVWVAIPLVFTAEQGNAQGQARIRMRQDSGQAPPRPSEAGLQAMRGRYQYDESRTLSELDDAPTFTPFTERPELVNRSEVARLLQDSYPPLLRDAGIGGEVLVWFLIDDQGGVMQVRVSESSGREELDAAALDVAQGMRFTPARNDGKPVPVWVAIPIVFSAR